MGRTRPRFLWILTAVACLGAAPLAGAQALPEEPPESSTTTTEPSESTTTVPGATSTTSPATPTTAPSPPTTAYVPPVPPELVGDPRLPFLVDPGPDDGIDIPVAQQSFDPLSVTVLPERVAAAREALTAAQDDLRAQQDRISARSSELARLRARFRDLRGDVRRAVREAAAARRELADHAVTAYMVGPLDEQLALVRSADVVDVGVARSYLDVVLSTRERLVRRYEATRRGLSRDQGELAEGLGEVESELTRLTAQIPSAFVRVIAASEELAAYEAGAHAYIDGFVFPVAGEVEFIDSWGYPRMTGTPSAHWHQGTDIFAPGGTPLVAAENGVLHRIGTASLGGNKLWVVGDSGHEYYYAHLSGFAEGIREGQRVRAGQVVGYVGDTGNARGTSPHLHFEIHPRGLGPANPYPLLKAAYGSRPMVRATVPTTVPEATVAPTAGA